MSIRVLGVLYTPLNQVVQNVPIKVVTTSGFGNVLTTSEAIYFTDNQGNYDFNLAFGTHELYVMFTDTFELIGTTVANDSLIDPSYTISDLLQYTTPLPNQNEECIRHDFDSCISDLENAWDTCIVQLSQQVVQGDTGVCTAMTTYTNDRLQACSAELTDTIVAGDAAVLLESQAYADATGAEIGCCTTLLDTRLTSICSTFTAYTTSNDVAIAQMCTDFQAGDACILQQANAYADVCNGVVCADLQNMVQACDAAAYQCMSAISCCVTQVETNQNRTYCQATPPTTGKPGDTWYDSDDNNKPYYMNNACQWTEVRDGCVPSLVTCTQGLTGDITVLECDIINLEADVCLQQAGYDIVVSAGDATASIALLATSYSNTDVACSEILMQADKVAMHNGNGNCRSYPFYIQNNCVYMSNAYIQNLTGDKINAYTTIRAGAGVTTAGMNGDDSGTDTSNRNRSYRFWAGGEYARSSTGVPCAPFRVTNSGAMIATNAFIEGEINASCLVFTDPGGVPPEITNAQLAADIADANAAAACTKAVSACTCGINCGNTAKSCAATAQTTANTACTNAATAQTKATSACTCGINCGNAAKGQASTACQCAINCGNAAKSCAVAEGTAACTWTENRIYPCQSSIQIKSGNYVVGVSGWAVDCNGNAEFNNAVVRGTISAATGCFCGTIYANCIVGDITSSSVCSMAAKSGFYNWFTHDTVTVQRNPTSAYWLKVDGLRGRMCAGAGTSSEGGTVFPYLSKIETRLVHAGVQCDCAVMTLFGSVPDFINCADMVTGSLVACIPAGTGSYSICLQSRTCTASAVCAGHLLCAQCLHYSYFRQGTVFS